MCVFIRESSTPCLAWGCGRQSWRKDGSVPPGPTPPPTPTPDPSSSVGLTGLFHLSFSLQPRPVLGAPAGGHTDLGPHPSCAASWRGACIPPSAEWGEPLSVHSELSGSPPSPGTGKLQLIWGTLYYRVSGFSGEDALTCGQTETLRREGLPPQGPLSPYTCPPGSWVTLGRALPLSCKVATVAASMVFILSQGRGLGDKGHGAEGRAERWSLWPLPSSPPPSTQVLGRGQNPSPSVSP